MDGRMNDEQLIELVRQFRVLYDLSHPKYMDTAYKLAIWKDIATDMNETVSACKARWNNIRDNYRKSLKKTTTKNGSNGKRFKHYKYSEELNFLMKYCYEKESKTPNDCPEAETPDQEDEARSKAESSDAHATEVPLPKVDAILSEETEPIEVTQIRAPAPLANHIVPLANHISPLANQIAPPAQRPSSARKSPARRLAPRRATSSKLIEFLISKNQSAATQHPVDAFLGGVAPTLKTLPPYYLSLAKSEIFAVAQKYEMKMILEQHSYQEPANQKRPGTSTPPSPPLEALAGFQCQRQQESAATPAADSGSNEASRK